MHMHTVDRTNCRMNNLRIEVSLNLFSFGQAFVVKACELNIDWAGVFATFSQHTLTLSDFDMILAPNSIKS